MPFTLAHPAAVLPLRRYLPLSALVAGSLAPDFEYPLRLAAVSRFSHTPGGILYFCVPVGLLSLWLFHRLIKRPAVLLLPECVRRRIGFPLPPFRFWPAGRLLVLLLALAVGALTHVAWDSFTHEYGWVVERWPALQANVFTAAGHELRLYKVLQYGSSVLGLLVLALCFTYWLLSGPAAESGGAAGLPERMRRRVVAAIVLSTLAAAVGVGLLTASPEAGLHAAQVFVVQAAIGGMLGFAACLLLYSLTWQLSPPHTSGR